MLLPDAERAELVSELLDSLPRPTTGDERSDEQWIAEVERRAREALSGSGGLSWEAARAQVSEHLPRK
ncbi:MAG: addiction module protein [Candidatus Binatus sp.]|uniref:addiction module protein n=1 Tax=Candidatus Binatus sp. TaxID=2811406 RepID=UPI0027246B79|nr:addiction module protein [Candidatus Binatus sp.]MDO8433571.1 addiction module protein [Candidatus Binatus sp.]